MTQNLTIRLDDVRDVVVQTLGVDAHALALADAPLLGALPELDSMGVLELLAALEEHFGIEVDGDELRVEAFETLGSLVEFVAASA
ncbi:MAG: acyl carrier protein [Chloroflexi bacterium]|nr:acyl carrier protein [Chloroflexota bacterium]